MVQHRARRHDAAANQARGVELCRQAARDGADLVVFPELWQTGYVPPAPAVDAAPVDAWLEPFRAEARTLAVAVVVTYLEPAPSGLRNAAAIIDSHGDLAGVHRKVHLCDFAWERALVPGETFDPVDLRTRAGVVRTGAMICFDREFPESARTLRLRGAELIVCPNACMLCDDRVGQARALAFENVTAIALANYPVPEFNGRSFLFDGVSMAGGRPRDHRRVVAGSAPGLVTADLDLERLREFRAEAIWQPHRRRPAAYHDAATEGGG
jgi:predicted amidohydrolase